MRQTLSIIILLCAQWVLGQEVMFSHSEHSATRFNPALTGEFRGTYRLTGLYRTLNESFAQTPHLQFDYNLGVKNSQDWIGLGIGFTQDQIGSLIRFERSHVGLSGAYHKDLDGTQNKILTLGFSSGLLLESYNVTGEIRTEDIILGLGNGGPIAMDLNNQNVNYLKNAVGLTYRHGFATGHRILGGLSYHFYQHLDGHDNDDISWPQGISAFLQGKYMIQNHLMLEPKVLYYQLEHQNQYYLAIPVHFILEEYNTSMGMGPSFRSQNNWGGLINIKYQQFEIGYQFESGGSIFPASHELMFILKGNISKDKKYEPVLFCPRY